MKQTLEERVKAAGGTITNDPVYGKCIVNKNGLIALIGTNRKKKKPFSMSFMNRAIVWALMKLLRVQAIQISDNAPFSFDVETELISTLKRLQFVETVQWGWLRGFTRVVINKNGVYIGHKTNNTGRKMALTKVENPLTSLEQSIKYFDRI